MQFGCVGGAGLLARALLDAKRPGSWALRLWRNQPITAPIVPKVRLSGLDRWQPRCQERAICAMVVEVSVAQVVALHAAAAHKLIVALNRSLQTT